MCTYMYMYYMYIVYMLYVHDNMYHVLCSWDWDDEETNTSGNAGGNVSPLLLAYMNMYCTVHVCTLITVSILTYSLSILLGSLLLLSPLPPCVWPGAPRAPSFPPPSPSPQGAEEIDIGGGIRSDGVARASPADVQQLETKVCLHFYCTVLTLNEYCTHTIALCWVCAVSTCTCIYM